MFFLRTKSIVSPKVRLGANSHISPITMAAILHAGYTRILTLKRSDSLEVLVDEEGQIGDYTPIGRTWSNEAVCGWEEVQPTKDRKRKEKDGKPIEGKSRRGNLRKAGENHLPKKRVIFGQSVVKMYPVDKIMRKTKTKFKRVKKVVMATNLGVW